MFREILKMLFRSHPKYLLLLFLSLLFKFLLAHTFFQKLFHNHQFLIFSFARDDVGEPFSFLHHDHLSEAPIKYPAKNILQDLWPAQRKYIFGRIFFPSPSPPPLSQSLLPSPCSSSSSGIKEERVCVRACVCVCERKRERASYRRLLVPLQKGYLWCRCANTEMFLYAENNN